MRFIPVCIAALLLAGCANSGGGGSVPRPKTVLVSDFVFASDVVAIDRSFTARLERKVGSFPTFERKQRTAERVNDEIVATMVATLREAGLDAQPGSEDGLSLSDDAVVVSGRLRAADAAGAAANDKKKTDKNNQIGFGAGHGGVAADMSISHFAAGGKRPLASFTADAPSGRQGSAVSAKLAAAQNSAIAAALAASDAAKEKLSPDVEAQARRLGRATGERVVAFARQHGWVAHEVAALDDKPAKLPARNPEKKTEKKPPE